MTTELEATKPFLQWLNEEFFSTEVQRSERPVTKESYSRELGLWAIANIAEIEKCSLYKAIESLSATIDLIETIRHHEIDLYATCRDSEEP